jgi:hypothetical protein
MENIMSSIYLTYEEYKRNYYKVQKLYNEILEEKEKLFAKTQPKSTKFDKINVDGGNISNSFDDYLIIKEKKQIDKRLDEIKIISEDRKKLLDAKEDELRKSKEWIDKIYVYKYIENLQVRKIIHLVPYEEAQVYRKLEEIKKTLKERKEK